MKIHGSPVRGWAFSFTVLACAAGFAGAQGNAPIPTPAAQAPAKAPASAPAATPAANPGVAQTPSDASKFLRFVRAAAGGAKVRNIYDAQGVTISEVEAGGLLAVHGERSGWLDVESPGGFSVWVFGEYLVPTSEPGVLQVGGSDVRMRPLPSPGAESLPLRQLLSNGQRVRLIARKDMSKPLAEDWVNVWSPPGTRGWVPATETEALAAGVDGAAQWAAAVTTARKSLGSAKPLPANSPGETGGALAQGDSAAVSEALEKAEKQLSAERAKQERGVAPDYDAARTAYEAVLALGPGESTTKLVKDRIELCTAFADGVKLSAELEAQKQSIDAALRKRQEEMQRAAGRGVFEGRFDGRGFVERVQVPGEPKPVYLVRFGGDLLAELQCSQGRYNLGDFVGCEVGYNGREVRGAIKSTNQAMNRPRAIDVARIEVLTSTKGR